MKKTKLIWMSGLLVILVICGWVLWGLGLPGRHFPPAAGPSQ
jgi:hypothetical protein